MNKIKVSVICMTYNHVRFIRQALDGFVMQKTNFPFEVLVYDDASNDGTSDIVREYAKKYPEIIKPIIQKQNQYSRGINMSKKFIWPLIRGEYVAVCDGDDYWTDPNKLQIQSDFLDKHSDYSLCFHRAREFWDDSSHPEHTWPERNTRLTLESLMRKNIIPNCSVMYRWQDPSKEWPKKIFPADWYTHLFFARQGKIGFIPRVMVRYRRQPNGLSFVATISKEATHRCWGTREMNFFIAVEKNIAPNPSEYHKFVCSIAFEIAYSYASGGEIDNAISILKQCPDMLEQAYKNRFKKYKHWQHKFNRLLILTAVLFISTIILFLMLTGVISF